MVDLPAALDAGPDDVREAEAVVARLTAPAGSVAAALAADLAAGLDGRALMITATGEAATLAQDHWQTTLAARGLDVVAVAAPGVARIHLHDDPGSAHGYAGSGDAVLVGEVIGQGTSAAARYASLAAVADALGTALTAGGA